MISKKTSSDSRIIGPHSGREPGLPTEKCLEWMDSHSECSVLYISFGSQNTISPSQMMALAMGLEESGKPFIWCIRPPTGFDLKSEFRTEWLPKGFEKRMNETNQGLVVHGWAPQLDILCHRSTGAFLSHCGWNSVVESLSQGVPIIGWPLAAEQGYNSKMLVEEMGVSIELTRGTQSNLVKEDVKKVVNIAMEKEGKGEEMRRKAVDMGELIRAAISDEEEGSPPLCGTKPFAELSVLRLRSGSILLIEMDETMKEFQKKLVEVEIEAENFLLARNQLVENDRLRNSNREALTALRKMAKTTKSSVPSPFESLMRDIESIPLVKEVCSTCGDHDPKEKTWLMFPGTDVFAGVPFHAAHTILEKEQTLLDFEAKKLQSYVKEKSLWISEKGVLADKISPGVLRSLVTLTNQGKTEEKD
ncbi:hypothetical protein M9H77_33425 [Catharanthus roseus]|uniref:Uncharacterized protein n=1 Tax=Catharanthus roseus TaxID=4058 RepID=A0ACB9ZIP9_CATRO|nr:hypothetical protein M9H77_33425 [Catharanthus roseus]